MRGVTRVVMVTGMFAGVLLHGDCGVVWVVAGLSRCYKGVCYGVWCGSATELVTGYLGDEDGC